MQPKPDAKIVLPPIPAKRYFTIGEVSELCGVKPHVLRYWEQEFTQLRPMKRRGNRRYYQHHEVLLVRRIRELLYEQGFTISGARNRLGEVLGKGRDAAAVLAEPIPVTYEVTEHEVEDIRRTLLEALELLAPDGDAQQPPADSGETQRA
jgi:DNA-binding transcriptional MerR regulator